MSGAKGGTAVVPASAFMLPVVGAAVLVGAAVVGVGVVAYGAFRLGKKIYDEVDECISQAADEALEDQLAQARMVRTSAKLAPESGVSGTEPGDEGRESGAKAFEDLERKHEEFIAGLEREVAQRKEWEKKKGLSDKKSAAYEAALKKARRQFELKKKFYMEITEKCDEPDFGEQRREIRDKITSLRPYLPVFVREKERQLSRLAKNPRAHNMMIAELDRKIAGMSGREDELLAVSKALINLEEHWLAEYLAPSEKADFIKSAARLSDRILGSAGQDFEAEIQDLEQRLKQALEKARAAEMSDRFQRNRQKLLTAMENKGYQIVEEETGAELVEYSFISGTDRKRQVAFSIKRPEIENDMLDDLTMVVDPEGFENEEERRKAGEEIINELDSEGIDVSCIDLTAAIGDMDRERVAEAIGKQLFREGKMKDAKVIWRDNKVVVEGKSFELGNSIEEIARDVLGGGGGDPKATVEQKRRLKETE